MANEVTVTDPLGTRIFLTEACFASLKKEEQESYDDIKMTIKKPALLVELEKEGQKELYYFRSVRWQTTLLVTVGFKNERWEAIRCTRDPSNSQLSEILKTGKQII